MKVSSTLKQRALALFFAACAGIAFWMAMSDNSRRDDVEKVLRATRDIAANTQIAKKDFAVVEAGSYNLQKDVLRAEDAEKLIGLYAAHEILKDREIHVSDVIKDQKPENAYLYEPGKIIVAFDTDLSRAVGGLLKEGSLVSLDGYLKDMNGGAGRTELMPGPPVKVCQILNSSANEAKKEAGSMNSGSGAKPASVVVEVSSMGQASWINRISNEGKIYCYLHTGTGSDVLKSGSAVESAAAVTETPAAPGQTEPAITDDAPIQSDGGGFKAQ